MNKSYFLIKRIGPKIISPYIYYGNAVLLVNFGNIIICLKNFSNDPYIKLII